MSEAAMASMRERGEVTIPKKIREAIHLEAGEAVEFIPIGQDAVLMTPKRLELKEARRMIRAVLKRSRVKAEDVLAGLAESRADVFQKHFGSKRRGKKR